MKKIFLVPSFVCSVALVVVLQSGPALGGFSVPNPSPPPSAGDVVNAIQGAAGQAGEAVSNLTADQQREADDALRDLEAKAQAAADAMQSALNQKVTQLNSYYNDQRRSRQASQKSALERSLSKKKIVAGAQMTYGRSALKNKSAVASGSTNSQQTPKILSISSTSGEPGDALLISGSGFSEATEVFFLVALNRTEKGIVSFANDTQLMVQVPAVTGVPAFNGLVYVRREDGQKSPGTTFRFTPITVVQKYEFENPLDTGDSILHNDGRARDIMNVYSFNHSIMFVRHVVRGGPIGFRSDDTLFTNRRLKNGWIVEDILFNGDIQPLFYKAQLKSSGKGSDSLRLQVHGWTVVPNGRGSGYNLSLLIRGPEGLSYK